MNIARRLFLKLFPLLAVRGSLLAAAELQAAPIYLGQGTMAGEVTDSTTLLQTRLTSVTQLDADGDLPGASGVVCFEWSTQDDFSSAQRTPFQTAIDTSDFIVRAELKGLTPNTTYYYRVIYPITDKGIPLFSPFIPGNKGPHNMASWPFCDTFFLWGKSVADGGD